MARVSRNFRTSTPPSSRALAPTFDRRVLLATGFVIAMLLCGRAFALPGNVLSDQKVSDLAGGFTGVLDDGDEFGNAIAHVGDLNGDLKQDIVVGARFDDDGGVSRGAAWVLFLETDGTVLSSVKISDLSGSFSGTLDDSDQFGSSITSLGDVDGDDIVDVAVGAIGDDDGGSGRGAVWILFLNADGTVKGHQKISSSAGSFSGSLSNDDEFGSAVAGVGDVDNDAIPDLVVGARLDDDGGTDRGALWVLFLNANGTVKAHSKISDTTPGIAGSFGDMDFFGASASRLGDLDDDGVPDVVGGAVGDDDGGAERGAVYVIRLNSDGSVKGVQKISNTVGGFTATIDDNDQLGSSVAVIPDLNNDGLDELAVGAIGDDDGGADRGAIHVLFISNTGLVTLRRKISATLGGFTGPLANGDFFGSSAVQAKDINGDGVADLVVGARRDDDGGSNRGAVWVALLDGMPGAFCGDDVLDPGEDCDDGNELNGDCCDDSCEFDAASTPCPNGTVCDGDEVCDGSGGCGSGSPLDCNDGEPCTQDICDPISGCESSTGPATMCLLPGKQKFDVVDKANDKSDKIKWKWQQGEETFFTDFGNPVNGPLTEYTLCVYDTTATTPSLKASIALVPGANWVLQAGKGYKYKDSTSAQNGVKNVLLRAGGPGKAKINFAASGIPLVMPIPYSVTEIFDQDPEVLVQLVNDLGFCWTSTFGSPAVKNTVEIFKDKSP
jgi:hypothetical protein